MGAAAGGMAPRSLGKASIGRRECNFEAGYAGAPKQMLFLAMNAVTTKRPHDI